MDFDQMKLDSINKKFDRSIWKSPTESRKTYNFYVQARKQI